MMNFILEHDDTFDDGMVFWLQANNVQQKHIKQAQLIDKENFSNDCFGICVNCEIDGDTKEFFICQDAIDCELYYVDNNGEKHWFEYTLTQEENEEAINYCKKLIA